MGKIGITNYKEFDEIIKPFFWVDHGTTASVCLNIGGYKDEIFQSREDEGFEGGGYDWEALARVFITEQVPELKKMSALILREVCFALTLKIKMR